MDEMSSLSIPNIPSDNQSTPPPEINSSNKNSNKISIILLIFIVFILIGLISYLLFFKISTNQNQTTNLTTNSPNNTISPTSITSLSPTSIISSGLTPKYIGNYDVVVKYNKDSPCNNPNNYLLACLSDIYLKDKKTGQEIFINTVDNVINNDVRIPVYRKGYIFLIKRTGNFKTPYDYMDHLWVMDGNNHGKEVYSHPGFEFSVSSDGQSVAVIGTNLVQIISVTSGKSLEFSQFNLESCEPDAKERESLSNITLRDWSNSDTQLWGDTEGEYGIVGCFWRLDLTTSSFNYYPVPILPGALENFNIEKLVATYIDKPPFVKVTSFSLYLYDLETKQSTKIDTIDSNGEFQIIGWDNPTILRYKTSKGEQTYKLNK